jgi:hypothetical protein
MDLTPDSEDDFQAYGDGGVIWIEFKHSEHRWGQTSRGEKLEMARVGLEPEEVKELIIQLLAAL